MDISKPVEVAIVGAGPAGLAAAHSCLVRGIRFVVLEGGPEVAFRSIDNAATVGHGVGGAGLYSDGKLSYYPSAHALWSLPSTHILRQAYSWLHQLIADFLTEEPPFPDCTLLDEWQFFPRERSFTQKQYPSTVLSDQQRELLLHRLLAPIQHRILAHTTVTGIEREGNGFRLSLSIQNSEPRADLLASQIIYCGGRFGALDFLRLFPRIPNGFLRFEYGVRIEQPQHRFCLNGYDANDTKLILSASDRASEWRTFCECRHGQVVMCEHNGLRSYSGLSGEDSNNSNLGFMTRLLNPTLYKEAETEIDRLVTGQIHHAQLPMATFSKKLRDGQIFGQKLDARFRQGFDAFAQEFDIADAEVYLPCLEGTGFYPWTTAHLETAIPGVYLAGDCVGKFRGLLAAFLSGYYVGERAALREFESADDLRAGFHIKRSSITSMPMVFTAQSKALFYCRDVICEYVLKHGGLPLNPFRVFDYFLSDRVDRDAVRRGNNQLVKACDEIWVFGPVADGVLFEVVYALNIGKPIRFFTVSTHADQIKEITNPSAVKFESEVHAPGTTRESLLHSIQVAFERRHAFRNESDLPL